jgi:hypothetical protein
MKRILLLPVLWTVFIVLLCISCEDAGQDLDEIPPATLSLPGFSYDGNQTVFASLYPGEMNIDSFSVTTLTAKFDGPGTEDLSIEDIIIESDNEGDEGEDVQLLIASDEDGSGTLNAADLMLPIFRFSMFPGEYVEIPNWFIDTATLDMAEAVDTTNPDTLLMRISYGSLNAVNESAPLILMITPDPDLVNVDPDKLITITDKALFTEIEYSGVTMFTGDLYILLFHDENDNQTPDSGEAASEASDPTTITTSRNFTASSDDHEVELKVSKDTPLQ